MATTSPAAGGSAAAAAAGQVSGPGGQAGAADVLSGPEQAARVAAYLALAQSVRGNTMDAEVGYLDPAKAPPLPGAAFHPSCVCDHVQTVLTPCACTKLAIARCLPLLVRMVCGCAPSLLWEARAHLGLAHACRVGAGADSPQWHGGLDGKRAATRHRAGAGPAEHDLRSPPLGPLGGSLMPAELRLLCMHACMHACQPPSPATPEPDVLPAWPQALLARYAPLGSSGCPLFARKFGAPALGAVAQVAAEYLAG